MNFMNDFSHRSRTYATHAAAAAACLTMMIVGMTSSASAQQGSIPACTAQSCDATFMQLNVNEIQYAPSVFKLQARISQAKIPVGDAVFDSIHVSLIRPGDANPRRVCTEVLNNIRVRNSVLNLDIGRQMTTCQLEEVIAQEQNLAFEICINSSDNCLKPIALGSTPFAVKSSFAKVAQKAHEANESVQAHYAHRATADTELFVGEQRLEDGYLDFATPDGNAAASPATTGWERFSNDLKAHMRSVYGPTMETTQASPVGGFIQWTPVNPAETSGLGTETSLGNLHIVAKDEATASKVLKPLARLMVHAEESHITGQLQVHGDVIFHGDVDLRGNTTVSLGPDSVDSSHIIDGSIRSADMGINSVESIHITNGSVTGADIANNTVTSDDILNGSVTGADIANNTVTTDDILNNTIESADIRNSTIVAADVAINGLRFNNLLLYGSSQSNWAVQNSGSSSSDSTYRDNVIPGSTGLDACFLTYTRIRALQGYCQVLRNSANEWRIRAYRASCGAICYY